MSILCDNKASQWQGQVMESHNTGSVTHLDAWYQVTVCMAVCKLKPVITSLDITSQLSCIEPCFDVSVQQGGLYKA